MPGNPLTAFSRRPNRLWAQGVIADQLADLGGDPTSCQWNDCMARALEIWDSGSLPHPGQCARKAVQEIGLDC